MIMKQEVLDAMHSSTTTRVIIDDLILVVEIKDVIYAGEVE